MTSQTKSADLAKTTEMLSGAAMVIRALSDEGVEYLYGYPGGAVLHIYDALFQQNKVKHVLVRHEQAATHMADAYARASGKAGVVLVTSGPGATNAVTGIRGGPWKLRCLSRIWSTNVQRRFPTKPPSKLIFTVWMRTTVCHEVPILGHPQDRASTNPRFSES